MTSTMCAWAASSPQPGPLLPADLPSSQPTIFLRWAGRSLWVRLLLVGALWTALGVVFALPALSMDHWNRILLGSLAQWWAWGLATPLIFWADSRLPIKEKQLGLRIAAHLLASMVLTVLYFYIFSALRALFGLLPWNELAQARFLPAAFRSGLLWSWLVYWAIFGVRQTFLYYEHYLASELRLERLQRSYSQARLNALRMQLDPHFLFNALNTISSQVERDPRLARRMLEHVGDLLRLSLEARDRQEIPLAEELAFLEHYLAIQKIRFGSSLNVELSIAPDVKHALVPCFVIQPLVENAIRHGLSSRTGGGTVRVAAAQIASRLEIRVQDDGVGLPPGWSLDSCSGIGLSVTRQRVAGLHGEELGRFAVRRRLTGGTEVEISFPFRTHGELAHGLAS
jgi:two-component system, LytTR family, sensor kinase